MAQHQHPFDVQFTDSALSHLRNYPRSDQIRILARIEQLAKAPLAMPNVKRLVAHDVTFRLRVGRYRVLFDRDDIIRVIDVIDILPRGRAYRRK